MVSYFMATMFAPYMGFEDGIILYGDNVCPVYGF